MLRFNYRRITTIVLISAVLRTWECINAERMQAVYGFQGAIGALAQGQLLHYNVKLNACRLISGSEDHPEFTDTFGGEVDHYRSINQREPEPKTNLVFHQQKKVYNNTGHLAQLSREIEIWSNNSVTVRSIIYTADLGVVTYVYEHACRMESLNHTLADVYLRVSGSPAHLFKFADISKSLEEGETVSFTAMVFLCSGGRESLYSSIGGHLTNYDISTDTDMGIIDTTFASTVHYNDDSHMVDVLRMRVFDNRTIEIIDSRGKPPHMNPVQEHRIHCFLESGMPGGTVSFFAV